MAVDVSADAGDTTTGSGVGLTPDVADGVDEGEAVAVGLGVTVGAGAGEGMGVAVGAGVGVAVAVGLGVGSGVGEGSGAGDAVGKGVGVCTGLGVGVGVVGGEMLTMISESPAIGRSSLCRSFTTPENAYEPSLSEAATV